MNVINEKSVTAGTMTDCKNGINAHEERLHRDRNFITKVRFGEIKMNSSLLGEKIVCRMPTKQEVEAFEVIEKYFIDKQEEILTYLGEIKTNEKLVSQLQKYVVVEIVLPEFEISEIDFNMDKNKLISILLGYQFFHQAAWLVWDKLTRVKK